MRYTSAALSVDGILELLDSKGLTIDCKTTATNHLSQIGFFRLRQYMHHFYVMNNNGEYAFEQKTCFKDIIDLYNFDNDLRIRLFEVIITIEKGNIFLMEHEKINTSKIYTVLCCIQYLLRSNNIHASFAKYIIDLTEAYPTINLPDLGFTPNWRQEPIWQ